MSGGRCAVRTAQQQADEQVRMLGDEPGDRFADVALHQVRLVHVTEKAVLVELADERQELVMGIGGETAAGDVDDRVAVLLGDRREAGEGIESVDAARQVLRLQHRAELGPAVEAAALATGAFLVAGGGYLYCVYNQ